MENIEQNGTIQGNNWKSCVIIVEIIIQYTLIFVICIHYYYYFAKYNRNINFEGDINEFIMVLNETKLKVGSIFMKSFKNYSKYAPINNITGNPFLILFITSSGPHVWYAINAYCSIRVYLPSNYFIFVALNKNASTELQKYGVPTILYTYTAPPIQKTVLKVFITYQFLLSGIDVFFADVDLVFFDNPLKILNNNSDLEISYELAYFKHQFKQFGGQNVNTGIYKINSNPNSIRFVKKWIELCYNLKTEEQTALNNYINSQNGTWISDDVYRIFCSDLNFSFSFHYFDTLIVTMSNSLYAHRIRKTFTKEAIRRNILKPVVFHLAWYWPTRKPSVLYEKNAWFNDFPKSKKCKDVPPNGTKLIWDKKYDLPESPQIPRKLPIEYFPP